MYQEYLVKTTIVFLLIFVNFGGLKANNVPLTGGQLSLLDGTESSYICKKKAGKTLIHLKHSELATDKYVYVITNNKNIILGYSEDRSVDLSDAPHGTYRVWGVAYSGQPQRPTEVPISQAGFASEGFALSENYVRILYANLQPQRISTNDRDYYAITEYVAPVVAFQTKKTPQSEFVFVVTNYRRRVVGITTTQFDFTDFGEGQYQVYGYSYTGELKLKPGDFMMGAISAGCYEKSENYVVVDKKIPAGFPLIQRVADPLPENTTMIAATDDTFLEYQTAELPAAEAVMFDQEAADMDLRMIEKLERSLNAACQAYAGMIVPDKNQLFINDGTLTISATTSDAAVTDYYADLQYLMVAQKTGLIEAVATAPAFMVGQSGSYEIYPMVANIHHPEQANYFDNEQILLGKTKLSTLRNQLAQSAICSDLGATPATIVVTSTGQNCLADAGTMSASESLVYLTSETMTLSAQQLEKAAVPAGYEKIYLLTWQNQIIDQNRQPDFSVSTAGSYGIICLIAKTSTPTDRNYLNLAHIGKTTGTSIFQLIEYIDVEGICASVSGWSLTEVINDNNFGFQGNTTPQHICIVSR